MCSWAKAKDVPWEISSMLAEFLYAKEPREQRLRIYKSSRIIRARDIFNICVDSLFPS